MTSWESTTSQSLVNKPDAMKRQKNEDKNYRLWFRIRSPFLLPVQFPGHACEWEPFSFTEAGCLLCGAHHRCCQNSSCVEFEQDDGQIVCEITGNVIREREMRTEWGAVARTYVDSRAASKGQERGSATGRARAPCDTWLFVNRVVCDILQSAATEDCKLQEKKRLYKSQITTMHKEIKHHLDKRGYVNLVRVAAAVAWQTRKLRRPLTLQPEQLAKLIDVCTDSITHLMLKYSNAHTMKLLNSETRRREFACSMLYLMRNGVDCRGECILPRIDMMAAILPLESQLQESFKIRSKSITEGENLLKIEVRRLNSL